MFITYNTRTLMHVIAGTRANILKMDFYIRFYIIRILFKKYIYKYVFVQCL